MKVERIEVSVERSQVPAKVLQAVDDKLANTRRNRIGNFRRSIVPQVQMRYRMKCITDWEVADDDLSQFVVSWLDIQATADGNLKATVNRCHWQDALMSRADIVGDLQIPGFWLPMPVEEAPEAVREAVKRLKNRSVAGATWDYAAVAFDETLGVAGEVVYEFNGWTSEGRQLEIHLTKDGKPLDVDTHCSQEELPTAVADVLTSVIRKPHVGPSFEPSVDGTGSDAAPISNQSRLAFRPEFIERSEPLGDGGQVWYEVIGRWRGDRLFLTIREDGQVFEISDGQLEPGDDDRATEPRKQETRHDSIRYD